jgi:hypothetical protein
MNAMNKHNLQKAASKNLCFQKIFYHVFIFPTVFSLNLNTGELECVTLNHGGKTHKTKYISELHAAQ